MIIDHIENKEGTEIVNLLDRSDAINDMVRIRAINTSPCDINPEFISNIYEECGGTYLVWRNNMGGRSDHLFFKAYERKIKTNERGRIRKYYDNRATATTAETSLGFEVSETWTLINKIPFESKEHRLEIESVLYSRQVYLYLGEQYSGSSKFIQVGIAQGTFSSKENALEANDFQVTIELPRLNTLTL